MPMAKAARWERRPDARPQEILDAALTIFAAKGYANTRLEEVAELAGVTKGTIYHYFASKDELLIEVVGRNQSRAFSELDEVLRDEQMPAPARIRLFVRKAFAESSHSNPDNSALLVQGVMREVPQLYLKWLTSGPARAWDILASMIEDGKAAGVFRHEVDSEVAARVLLSGLMLQLIWKRQPELRLAMRVDPDRLIDSALDVFLHGLRRSEAAFADAIDR
jgi:AcrR family transcriptional regulator